LTWRVEEEWGKGAELHERSAALCSPAAFAGHPARLVRLLNPTDQVVILGSSQPESDIDPGRALARGVGIGRRRTGGGAVLVGPGLVRWVDAFVPAGDPLWDDDVGRAFWWLGSAWADALAAAGVGSGEVWRRGLVRTPWSGRVCFAGLGPGEVTVGGRKVVGISQRRTRHGALFQCALPIVWDPAPLLDIMALDEARRVAGIGELSDVALGVGVEAAAAAVQALLSRLFATPPL
jgi:lipoate-protein ligase A